MDYSELIVVFFNCLNSVGILCFILISIYFIIVDKILQSIPENEIKRITKHILQSMNYVYLATPKQDIDSLINLIAVVQSTVSKDFAPFLQKNNNDTVKKTAKIIFYSIGTITLFLSFVWYLVMIDFDVAKLLVAFINNIINVGCMAGVEILFLYICAPRFIPLYPAYIDNFVLAVVRYFNCFSLPQNITYNDLLLYIYFINSYYFGSPTVENNLVNNQNLQKYVLQNPQSLTIASNAALSTSAVARLPQRNTNPP